MRWLRNEDDRWIEWFRVPQQSPPQRVVNHCSEQVGHKGVARTFGARDHPGNCRSHRLSCCVHRQAAIFRRNLRRSPLGDLGDLGAQELWCAAYRSARDRFHVNCVDCRRTQRGVRRGCSTRIRRSDSRMTTTARSSSSARVAAACHRSGNCGHGQDALADTQTSNPESAYFNCTRAMHTSRDWCGITYYVVGWPLTEMRSPETPPPQ